MWKWLLLFSFVAVVLSDEEFENPAHLPAKINSVKLLTRKGKDLSQLRGVLENIIRAGKPNKEQIAELNEYADDVLSNLNDFIKSLGLDPIGLPGFEESFQWFLFFGWVSLDDGWLRGLATIQRSGDVLLKYEYPNVKLEIPIGFSKLAFDYRYEAKFMGLGPKGKADGKVQGSKVTVNLNINMVNLKMNLDKFKFNTLGKVSLKFRGGIAGDIANVLVTIVLPILKPIIKAVLEGFITDGLNSMLNFYNGAICTLLADCPEQLANMYSDLTFIDTKYLA